MNMAKKKIYKEGEPIGSHGLILIKELPERQMKSYKERRILCQCPECGQPFETDLRRVTRSDTDAKKAVKRCPQCYKKDLSNINKEKAKSYIKDLSNQRFGQLIALIRFRFTKRS